MTWIIKKVNRIPTHCGVAYESVRSLARDHMIRVCYYCFEDINVSCTILKILLRKQKYHT